jgi:hypothetical protein
MDRPMDPVPRLIAERMLPCARATWHQGDHQDAASRSPSRNCFASLISGDNPTSRTPIRRGDVTRCCARATSGHAAAAPPSSEMNSRLFIRSPRR